MPNGKKGGAIFAFSGARRDHGNRDSEGNEKRQIKTTQQSAARLASRDVEGGKRARKGRQSVGGSLWMGAGFGFGLHEGEGLAEKGARFVVRFCDESPRGS